eukprot:TRINITY_DN11243_c0_g2_i2.p2 TRINITY_DN11243_c0_g2~~TRINITY_DN11243_c0_g2_i2.p2  ORF type:complete len:139 (-),score=42.43 TRINITY_DN11243_c0_g2_i2:63-479(-)
MYGHSNRWYLVKVIVEHEDMIVRMRKTIEDMKSQMKQLQLMCSIEVQRLTQEKTKQEAEYSLTIEKMSKELEASKQQMIILKEQTGVLLEYINKSSQSRNTAHTAEAFSVERRKAAELRTELNKLDKDIEELFAFNAK